jgi:hypothetical protein
MTARAIKKLFSQIPFPGPDVDAEVFNADEIWKYIEHNARELHEGFTKELISVRAAQCSIMSQLILHRTRDVRVSQWSIK